MLLECAYPILQFSHFEADAAELSQAAAYQAVDD